ncbi:MAG: hypothetical protein QOJ65_149, partial [Fimbriimonadaceae bacterium]|nr:hypothetical protein [Fimbriimonadaceae bacterium]
LLRIKAEVESAAAHKQKVAMLHLQILLHADKLEGIPAEVFRDSLELPKSFITEFTQMMGLSRLMREQGFTISRTS